MSVEQIEQQIAQNRQQHQRQRNALRDDKTLFPEAKTTKLKELDKAAQEQHERLVRDRQAAVQYTRDELYKRAFTLSFASIDSYRSLYTQANQSETPKELARLIQQAKNTNDTLLLKATHQVAYDRDWLSLIEGADPDVHRLIDYEFDNNLRTAADPAARTRQVEQRMAASIRNTGPRIP